MQGPHSTRRKSRVVLRQHARCTLLCMLWAAPAGVHSVQSGAILTVLVLMGIIGGLILKLDPLLRHNMLDTPRCVRARKIGSEPRMHITGTPLIHESTPLALHKHGAWAGRGCAPRCGWSGAQS